MTAKLATFLLVAGALMAPAAGYAADTKRQHARHDVPDGDDEGVCRRYGHYHQDQN